MSTTEQATATPARLADVYERQCCTRCGGSGRYSFNLMYGDTCFGCGGSGIKLTKRGAATRAYIDALMTTPAEAVAVGDRILVGMGKQKWQTVTEIRDNAVERSTGQILPADDPRVAQAEAAGAFIERERYAAQGQVAVYEGRILVTASETRTLPSGSPVRVSVPALNRALLQAAISYQAKLTKQGKVRKSEALA